MGSRRVVRAWPLLAIAASVASVAPALPAQRPMGIPVVLGADVDAGHGPTGDIFRVWRSYLARWPAQRGPNPHWSPAEQERLPHYDIVGSFTYGRPQFRKEYHGIVLGITPADSGPAAASDRYVIRTLFASDRGYREAVVVHVYAVRAGGRWLLSNALEQRTRGWRSTVVGPIAYAYPPTHVFDTARAARAVRFVDSLAAALDAGRMGRVTYVIAGDQSGLRHVLGLEQTPEPFGGRAFVRNRMIVSGARAMGEAHLHELAHFVIAHVVDPAAENHLAVEGAAAWAAARADDALGTYVRRLRQQLERRPTLALREVAGRENVLRNPAFYPLGAVLCQMAFERGGAGAVRRLLRAGPSPVDYERTLARVLGRRAEELDAAWREYVLAYRPPRPLP